MTDFRQEHPEGLILALDQMSAYLQASTTHVWSLVGQTPLVWVTPQRDIEAQLAEIYGIEVSAQTVSTITNKVLPLMFGQS